MRAYTVAATALTLGVPPKWLDNVLSHHRVDGVLQSRQGIARRITPAALLKLHVALNLSRALGVPIRKSLELAHQLVEANGEPVALTGAPFLRLDASLEHVTDLLHTELERALESTPLPRRGRPPHKKKAGRL